MNDKIKLELRIKVEKDDNEFFNDESNMKIKIINLEDKSYMMAKSAPFKDTQEARKNAFNSIMTMASKTLFK